MVVLLYSDTNYVLEGFSAEYSVTDCPLNCSNHGHCVNHSCVCEVAFVGEACEYEACPDQCGFTESRGWCEKIDGVYQCVCNQGFMGLDCGLDTKSSLGNSWHLIGRGNQAMQRTAHAGVYLKNLNKFLAFGGFDLNQPLGDLLSYDMNSSKWSNLSSLASNESRVNASESLFDEELEKETVIPHARYGHAMGALEDGFVLYGGQLADGRLSNEFFYFDALINEWILLAGKSRVRPPALTRHTLCVVNDSIVYVFGGSMANGEFSSKLYRVQLNTLGKLTHQFHS